MFKGLLYKPDGERIPFTTHIFFYVTLMFGIAFVIPPDWLGTGATHLFKFSVHHNVAHLWGISLITVSAANTLMLWLHSRLMAQFVGAFGFACWMYAGIAYILSDLPFGLLVVALPNMTFWLWYAMQIVIWRRYIES